MTILKCTVYSDLNGYENFDIIGKNDEAHIIINENEAYQIRINSKFGIKVVAAIKQNKSKFTYDEQEYLIRGFEIVESDKFENLKRVKRKKRKNIFYNPSMVWIYRNKCICSKCLKRFGTTSIENRKGIFKTDKNIEIEIAVQYCKTCQSYFMDEESLKIYEKKFGIILISKRSINSQLDQEELNFREDTVLSRNGYSAALYGPNDEDRIEIINDIIKRNEATIPELKEILSGFLSNRGKRFPQAAIKWTKDLDYLNSLSSNSYFVILGFNRRT